MGLHRYLDDLEEMMAHNLVGRHSRELLHVLGSKGVRRLWQGGPHIALDTRRLGVNLLLLLVLSSLPFTPRVGLFNWSIQRGRPHYFNARSRRSHYSDGAALLHHPHILGPKTGQGLILLSPHPCVHTLVKFSCHSYKRKALVKKKKGMRRKGMTSLTLTLFLLNVKVAQDELRRGFQTKAVEGKSLRVH